MNKAENCIEVDPLQNGRFRKSQERKIKEIIMSNLVFEFEVPEIRLSCRH